MAPTAKRRASAPKASNSGQSNSDVSEQPSGMIEISALQQRLLWPPLGKQGETGVGPQVDIVQATRLNGPHVNLPLTCGVCFIENGIRFDPDEFPDNARKTQERLATKIIESGTSPHLGKTIKVKEYSSKARKRIRFACSRDECSVTFQINFDSKRGHWFMKRNKGNFQHSCSAVKSAVAKAEKATSTCLESCHDAATAHVATAELSRQESSGSESSGLPECELARSGSQSLKRNSPELSSDHGALVSPKKSRTNTQKAKRQPSRKREQHGNDENFRANDSPVPQDEEAIPSRAETPKIRNGSARPKRVRTLRQLGYAEATSDIPDQPLEVKPQRRRSTRVSATRGTNDDDAATSSVNKVDPSPSSVVISIYSQDASLREDGGQNETSAHHPSSRSYADMFAATVPLPSRVESSLPPSYSHEALYYPTLSAQQAMPHMGDAHYASQHHLYETAYEPPPPVAARSGAQEEEEETNSAKLLHGEAEVALSSSMEAEGFDDIDFAVPNSVAHSQEPYEGAFPPYPNNNQNTAEQPRGDIANVGSWTRSMPADQEGDDSSSISTNWSALDFKT
ncbi:hypothetical protein ACA910_020760 [Epithemia clementina (nom. ined.)]